MASMYPAFVLSVLLLLKSFCMLCIVFGKKIGMQDCSVPPSKFYGYRLEAN
jgi:hypothetical protein